MPGDILIPKWKQLLQRAFDVRGGAGPMVVLDDVMPVVELIEAGDPEMALLRGDFNCMGGTVQLGGVGTFPVVGLANLTTDYLCIPSDCSVAHAVAGTQTISMVVGNYAAITAGAVGLASAGGLRVDTRKMGAPTVGPFPSSCVVFVYTTAAAFAAPLVEYTYLNPGVTQPMGIRGIVLAPGTCVAIQLGAAGAGAALLATFDWKERKAETQELQGF